jgi:hypothetical protein
MKVALMLAGATLIGLGAVAMTTGAGAAVVCNGDVCWHTHSAYTYPPSAGVVVHGDNWRWSHDEHYRWREHEGRGYWRDGKWNTF